VVIVPAAPTRDRRRGGTGASHCRRSGPGRAPDDDRSTAHGGRAARGAVERRRAPGRFGSACRREPDAAPRVRGAGRLASHGRLERRRL